MVSEPPPPKPKFVWKELCCAEEEGNTAFPGNFWGNLSIELDVPEATDDNEDYKIIYRIDKYNRTGYTPLQNFVCEQDFLESRVEGWYPTDMSMREKHLWLKSLWDTQNTAEQYPGQISGDTAEPTGKLWFSKNKFVKIHGVPQIVEASSILLNAPRASEERQLTSPEMFEHVMISAVTCRQVKVGMTKVWQKSEVALIDQTFTSGPSLTVAISVFDQPGHLVNFDKESLNLTKQLLLSEPLVQSVRKEMAEALGIPDRKLGALSQIDAVNISIAKADTNRRAGYKTSIMVKAGFNSSTWYESTKGSEETVGKEEEVFYDVNLTMSVLTKSVQEATRLANRLEQARRLFASGQLRAHVKISESVRVGEGMPCLSHYHCTATGLFCSSKKICRPCRFCNIDQFDSIDGICPQALCPNSGGFPECVDGDKLLQEIRKCESSHDFSVWTYNNGQPGVAPEVQPKPKPRPKWVTPYNRLVGAVMITQQRKEHGNCSAVNSQVQKYLETSAATCQSD